MAIITIARQAGTLGKEIAKGLAEKLGWHFISKELLEKELCTYGITKQHISKYDEKKPGLLASFSDQCDKYNNSFKLYFFEKVIDDPNCILLGRGGAFFLKNVPGVLRIRIIGNENIRIKRIMERLNCDEKAAQKIIIQKDKDRAGFSRFFYNMAWDDSDSYDIVINTDNLRTEIVYSIIEGAIKIFKREDYMQKLQTRLKELYLAQKIINHLLYEAKLPIHFLEADVHGTTATIMGTVEIRGLIEQTGKIVAKMEGVEEVENKIAFINSYPPIIS